MFYSHCDISVYAYNVPRLDSPFIILPHSLSSSNNFNRFHCPILNVYKKRINDIYLSSLTLSFHPGLFFFERQSFYTYHDPIFHNRFVK
jgi:hypothetical protein